MPIRAVNTSNQESVFAYLDAVLTYYKTTENASLGEWPTYEIGWRADKNSAFYRLAKEWFSARNVNVIRQHDSNRYLSTFILAAEFPPTLGYGRLVQELVRQAGWLSLYRSPESNLQEYINSIDVTAYTVAQRQSLTLDTDGYTAFLHLIQILSSIRYLLDTYENIDSICTQVSEQNTWDLDLVIRIAHAYKDILIPPHNLDNQATSPSPKFSYQLIKDELDWRLVLKHNLKKVSVPHPSSINLPRFSSGTLSIFSESENISLNDATQLVKVEVQEGFLEIECDFNNEFIPILKRNIGLQKLQFIVTVKDIDARPHQLYLGQIKRNDQMLIFGSTGTEIVSNTYIFKKGDILRIVPLSTTFGELLEKSVDFEQEENTGRLPVFQTKNTQTPSIQLGKLTLQFRSIPFSIRLREQSSWESTFNRNRKVIPYFFSPVVGMYIEGEFAEDDKPIVEFYRRIKQSNGEEIHVPIQTNYSSRTITPIRPIPSPGQYALTVHFGNDAPSSITFNLLPIKSIKLVEDKHLQLKMYAPVENFVLLGEHTCTSSFTEDLVDIHCNNYGMQDIEAHYIYRNAENRTIKSPVKFRFETIEEVVGHFRKTTSSGTSETLSIEEDLIANSYLEFRRTSLRDSTTPYKVSAYMEYAATTLRIFPECQVMYPDGSRLFSLAPLVSYVKHNQFSRLLLIVEYNGIELYRTEFKSRRRPIIDLEKEWHQGAFSTLTALPLDSLEPQYDLSLSTLPPNSLAYGMTENASGKEEIATFAYSCTLSSQSKLGKTTSFLAQCNEYMRPDEQATKDLEKILQSPNDSFELMEWLSKAAEWEYPYDIKIFAKLCDTYPVLVAWAELARNPENQNEAFALITDKAQRLNKAGMYYYPTLSEMTNHTRFSPELITIKDLNTLQRLGLLPSGAKPIELFAYCCQPFISDGKPVLAWLTLFWLRRYYMQQGTLNKFETCFPIAQACGLPLVSELAKEFTGNLPTYNQDCNNEQDFEKLLNDEQIHYGNPSLVRIQGLRRFLDALNKPTFSDTLSSIVAQRPLLYAEPYLRGFKTSTKWNCIIFLSLTAVCKQLGKNALLETLEKFWTFDHKTYIYLLKWMTKHEETARIYNSYYEYWMECFWREENV